MISKYFIVEEVQMENLMHYLGIRSITQKRREVALKKTKINLSTKSSDQTTLCQLREIMFGRQKLELRTPQ